MEGMGYSGGGEWIDIGFGGQKAIRRKGDNYDNTNYFN